MKIYPSSVTFTKGAAPDSKYNHTCFRYQVLSEKATTRGGPHALNKAVAEIDEHRFGKVLETRGYKVKREVPLKKEIMPNATFSGRRDYIVTDKDGKEFVVEKKSSVSKTRQSEIRNKKVNHEQLAQIVSYMVIGGYDFGLLVITMYHYTKDLSALTVGAEVEYEIKIEGRKILVDNQEYKYDIDSLSRYYKYSVYYRTTGELAPMPVNAYSKSMSPCKFCPLQKPCLKNVTGGLSDEDLKSIAPGLIDQHNDENPAKEPVIWVPKR